MIKGKRIEGRKRKKGEKMGKGEKINEGEVFKFGLNILIKEISPGLFFWTWEIFQVIIIWSIIIHSGN